MSVSDHDDSSSPKVKIIPLTYLEFYSGVGGWSFALKEACDNVNRWFEKDQVGGDSACIAFSTHCLGAYDHSDLCYKVFHHNFPEMKNLLASHQSRASTGENNHDDRSVGKERRSKKKQKIQTSSQRPIAIEKLTKKQMEEKKADIWMMSPPCQPHTRQHSNQKEDVDDPRSKSFLHLCDLISVMTVESLPKIILLENVIGFENSNSCKHWRRTLHSRQYSVLHFHLNPPQVGLPNDRPRYYSIAILVDKNNEINENSNNCLPTLSSIYKLDENQTDYKKNIDERPPIHTDIEPLNVKKEADQKSNKNEHLRPISFFLDPLSNNNDKQQSNDSDNSFIFVSEKILGRNASWCFDIVTSSDKRSACFTHSYGKYVRGTGSVLFIGDVDNKAKNTDIQEEQNDIDTVEKFQLVSPEERCFDTDWNGMDLKNKLRYFNGTEIARLMGFPINANLKAAEDEEDSKRANSFFSFPSDCTQKQCWKLMGNSLNVKVAGKVTELALRIFTESRHNLK